jgi:glycosyltransferase involved in cell wall biosynthesis
VAAQRKKRKRAEKSRPAGCRLSVIIPMRNAERTIARCLEAIVSQLGDTDEVIVVDDASTDGSATIAERFPVRVIRQTEHRDIGGSRNAGAAAARGELLLFTDADGVLVDGALDRVHRQLTGADGCRALVGVYAADGGPTNLASVIKNLWVRYTYLQSGKSGWIDWTFGCIFAVSAEVFADIGGYSDVYCRDFGGEDLELGIRLVRAGHRIRFDPQVEVAHLRHHSFLGVLLNDFRRAAGFLEVGLSMVGPAELLKTRRFANIDTDFLAGIALLGGSLPLLAAAVPCPPALALALVPATGYLALNLPYYRYLCSHGGLRLGAAGGVLLAGSQLASLGGMAYGLARRAAVRERVPETAGVC